MELTIKQEIISYHEDHSCNHVCSFVFSSKLCLFFRAMNIYAPNNFHEHVYVQKSCFMLPVRLCTVRFIFMNTLNLF